MYVYVRMYVLTYICRSHNELQKECSKLEQKCRTQEGCVLALESTVGQVEQRCRELERQVKGMQWKHKRAMKAIFNIVMEKEGEEEEGSLMGMEEEEVCVCVRTYVYTHFYVALVALLRSVCTDVFVCVLSTHTYVCVHVVHAVSSAHLCYVTYAG